MKNLKPKEGLPKEGDRLVFLGENGWDYQLKAALSVLTVGQSYTVKRVVVHGWHTDIWLLGFEETFNSVMFRHVDPLRVTRYLAGQDRNEKDAIRSHTYAEMEDGQTFPMCGYGWNRADGHRFSIFRGHVSTRGHCKTCDKNEAAGKPPVFEGWDHPTKWQ